MKLTFHLIIKSEIKERLLDREIVLLINQRKILFRSGLTQIRSGAMVIIVIGYIDSEHPTGPSNVVDSVIKGLEELTWHFSLILVAVGMAYGVNTGLKIIMPSVSFPVYGLALVCSIILQGILRIIKLDDYVDKNIITHIGSSATDYLVAFGVASINISVVIKYLVPIIVLSVIGFVFVVTWFWIVSPRFFRNYWFERGIYILGLSTGVMATGVILLRITDPEFKSGVLEDFGFAWIFLSFMDMVLVSLSPVLIMQGSGMIYSIVLMIIAASCLIICKKLFRKKDYKQNKNKCSISFDAVE